MQCFECSEALERTHLRATDCWGAFFLRHFTETQRPFFSVVAKTRNRDFSEAERTDVFCTVTLTTNHSVRQRMSQSLIQQQQSVWAFHSARVRACVCAIQYGHGREAFPRQSATAPHCPHTDFNCVHNRLCECRVLPPSRLPSIGEIDFTCNRACGMLRQNKTSCHAWTKSIFFCYVCMYTVKLDFEKRQNKNAIGLTSGFRGEIFGGLFINEFQNTD